MKTFQVPVRVNIQAKTYGDAWEIVNNMADMMGSHIDYVVEKPIETRLDGKSLSWSQWSPRVHAWHGKPQALAWKAAFPRPAR